MSSKINLQTCEYACKSSIFQDNQLIYYKYDTYIKLSDYNYLLKMIGEKEITLNKDEYVLQIKRRLEPELSDAIRNRVITCENHKYIVKRYVLLILNKMDIMEQITF